jgi:hypothetical protein
MSSSLTLSALVSTLWGAEREDRLEAPSTEGATLLAAPTPPVATKIPDPCPESVSESSLLSSNSSSSAEHTTDVRKVRWDTEES